MSSGQTAALVVLLFALVGAPAAALGPTVPDSTAPSALASGSGAGTLDSPASGALAPFGGQPPAVFEARSGAVDFSDPRAAGAVDRPSNTTFTVTIQPNGDARWRITSTFNLSTDAEVQSFEELATAFEGGETSQLGLEAFRRAAALASRATGRQMVLTDELRASSLPSDLPGTASLVLEFTWTNFGRTANDTVAVGDAFNTSDQWFEGLEPNQRLRLQWPRGWTLLQSPPVAVNNRSLIWVGPTSFDRNDIAATFAGNGGGLTTTNGTDGSTPGAGFPWLPVGGIALVAIVVGGYLLLRRPDEGETGTAADESPGGGGTGPAAGDATAEGTSGAGAGEAAAGEAADDVDVDLLSDEERIERLLEQNGGRMKQANIVKETGWSNAKVSQLLSAMDDEDRIDKLRIGRENLISFPDEDVTDARE